MSHDSSLSILDAEQLRTLQYQQLHNRLGHLFTENRTGGESGRNTVRGVCHLQSLWKRFGGHPKWQELMSPEQLTLLLSFDERLVFRCDEEEEPLRPGFIECVLARLPRLTTCALVNTEFACCYDELFSRPLLCPNPFPELRHLDLRRSTIRDVELLSLIRLMPRLETCDARCCFNTTWTGLEEARMIADRLHDASCLLIRPISESEKLGEHEWPLALYGHHLHRGEGGLLALWREIRIDEVGNFWRRMLNAAQTNALLNHDKRESFRIESTLSAEKVLLPGAFECVLSRLPQLRTLTLRSTVFEITFPELQIVPNPFPALRELYLDLTNVENRVVLDLVSVLPRLEVLGLKGCYKVSWRVMEVARASGGAQLRVLPESREEKVEADLATMEMLWTNPDSRENKEEFRRLSNEYAAVLKAMKTNPQPNGPWRLWKELGGVHCWRTHLRPSQLSLLLQHDMTSHIEFNVDVTESLDGADGSEHHLGSPSVSGAARRTSTATSTSTGTSSWSAVTDHSRSSTRSLAIDAGEVRAYFSHVVARLPHLTELSFDGCPVWPFMWKLPEDTILNPFPVLRRLRLRNTTCHAKDLIDLVRQIPTLEKGEEESAENGLLVDAAYVLYDDYGRSSLRQMCGGKVSVCHLDGTWHGLLYSQS